MQYLWALYVATINLRTNPYGRPYWGHKVRIINGNSRYLGSIAIEGGLPLNQLNKSSGWLGRVFKQVIPKYTRLQHTGIYADTLVAECDYIIPTTYQNDQIHAILGDMVQRWSRSSKNINYGLFCIKVRNEP